MLSLSSTLVALLHSEVPPSSLEPEDMARLASLPLEHLPPALKLGASLAVLSQVSSGQWTAETSPMSEFLCTRRRHID